MVDDVKKRPVGRPTKTDSQKAIRKAERAIVLVEKMALKDKNLAHNISRDLSIIQRDTMLQLALRNKGVDEHYIADKLKEAMESESVKIGNNGETHTYKDMNIRLKAIEMWVNIFGYKDKAKGPTSPKEGDKHIHLHNIDKEELDAALAAATVREDTEISED